MAGVRGNVAGKVSEGQTMLDLVNENSVFSPRAGKLLKLYAGE